MKRLNNKNIYYIVTGAEKAELAEIIVNEMVSEGARVFTLPSQAALDFIDIEKLKNIKNNTVKLDWSDDIKLPKEDAILVAPCTFNSLNAIASGLANSYLLCLIASGIGNNTPIFIAPAMNKGLWSHPLVKENIKKLESWGCRIIWPEIIQNKVTMMTPGKILDTLYFNFCRVNFNAEKKNHEHLDSNLIKYRDEYLDIFREIGKFLHENNLNLPTAGCVSVKVPEGILITSSGSDLKDLCREQLTLIACWDEIESRIEYAGECSPSSESPLHCVIHDNYKDNFVLHFHCPEITYNDEFDNFKTDTYIRYGGFDTGRAVLEKLKDGNFCIMKYHGEVLIGNDQNEIISAINKLMVK